MREKAVQQKKNIRKVNLLLQANFTYLNFRKIYYFFLHVNVYLYKDNKSLC